jgi:heme-degrading monooxygenase HmoA
MAWMLCANLQDSLGVPTSLLCSCRRNFVSPAEPPDPRPPYYAVIFTSIRNAQPDDGYAAMATRMEELAREQPGFLGLESARSADGLGITVSYWATEDAVLAWGRHAEHLIAQQLGRERWYERYTLRVCRVERRHTFSRTTTGGFP